MHPRMVAALLVVSMSVLVLGSAPASAQPLGPAAVIDAYTDALNAHDADAALMYVADDAVYLRPAGRFVGIDEVRGFIEGLIAQNVRIELIGERQVFRNYVTWTSRVTLTDPANPSALPRQIMNVAESVVRDGKIIFHTATPAPMAYRGVGVWD